MALRIASKAAPQRAQCLIHGIQKASTRQLSSSNRILQQEPNTARPDQFDDFFDRPKPREKAARDHYSDTFTQSNGIEKASDYATRHLRLKHKVNPARQRTPRPKATPEPNAVKIERFGETHELSPLLLRDLCQCSLCVDSSTRQKHFATVDIPLDIAPKAVRVDETHVHISWSNDVPGLDENHITSIPLSTIDNIIENGNPVKPRQPLPRALWDAKSYTEETRDFDYEAYMNDDSTLYAALKQLETHGLLFITKVPESAESVETLAQRIGPLKTTFYGKTWDVRSVPEAKNVAYTSQNLGFHMDLMYMKQPPHLQLLHCIRSSAAGGASLFSDSFRAIENMARRNFADFTTLSRIPATYHYDHADHYYHQRRPVIEQRRFQVGPTWFQDFSDFAIFKTKRKDIEDRMPNLTVMDFVDHVAWSPPFQGPFSVSSIDTARYGPPEQFLNLAIRNWHAAAQRFNDLIHLPENVYERMMKPGECVIFDNRRVLHARRAFEVGDAGKERWLRGAYIDKDPFLSKLKVMEDERKGAGQDDVTAEVQAEEPAVAVA
ncbi:hypothetical protein PRZ48_001718 [Zasmidium cellare]|uniref:Gamma-butyrobetaine dioxygenase n=1 Tax=Zasmidium cellare TaxID=395010 RepID=A0ABR0F4G2_ZASCE|nr:hypothetical protein PRZ48_001718 [Zasmidium cellare]